MARRKVYDEIIALFNYNPPPIKLSSESDFAFSYPNVFYDRHLDPRLCLRHIKSTPSLTLELSELVYDELINLKNKGQPLPFLSGNGSRFITESFRERYPPRTSILDAESIARFYSCASYMNCASVASTIALYPHSEAWAAFLDFLEGPEHERSQRPAMIDNYVLEVSHDYQTGELTFPKAVSSCATDELRQDIRAMLDRFKTLAAFQFHVPSTKVEDVFKEMGAVAERRIPSLQCPAVGFVSSQHMTSPVPPDSSKTMLPCIAALTQTNPRSQGQLESVSTTGPKGVKTWPTLNVKPTKGSYPHDLLFIQRAWTRAVQYDSTLIIFHCGNYERIGFRHRGSQTLFLSDLINVSECSDPGYGQVQIGLYMTILQDALDRIHQIDVGTKADSTTSAKRKQSSDVNVDRESKKPRTGLAISREQKSDDPTEDLCSLVLRETGRRDLALLWFKYGVFYSSAPAVLHRIGRTSDGQTCPATRGEQSYPPEDYFCLTLTSEIAEGATGKVHGANIEVQTSDCHVYSCEGVAKVALGDGERQRLRHEYAMYRYMGLKKVNGIATVYGLFEDAANEATVLVMGHVGTSLVKQQHYDDTGQVDLTAEQKEAFRTAMREIHEAGVRHYDIRPENLMMDDNGRATIIDFDMAKVKAGKRSRQREFRHLCCLLDGSYESPNQWPSPATSRSARSPPPDDDIIHGRI